MTDELKPVRCGCGGEAKVEPLPFETWNDIWDASVSQYLVRCDRCGMTTRLHDTEVQAVTAWNMAMGEGKDEIAITKGTWMMTLDGFHCSVCFYKCETTALPDVCPHCGAKMKG